jgi:transcriptional regulator with XRE-family HTH domain
MTPTDLAAWRFRLRLSKSEAARRLGITRDYLRKYLDPEQDEIPLTVALAATAIEAGLSPIGEQPSRYR